MSQEFHREDRYIVIKHKDLGNVPVAYREHLVRPLFALQAHLPVRECVVVESDWPEYDQVWQMIERRMTGQPPVTAAEELAAVLHWRGKHAQAVRERDALQQRLNVADQRVDDLQSELTKARDMVRWFYTHANVHQVGTAMMDAAREFIAHQPAPAAKGGHAGLDPQRIKGMIEAASGEYAIMIDPENGHFGWTFKRHPDGQWVSGRKATESEMYAARQHANSTGQGV